MMIYDACACFHVHGSCFMLLDGIRFCPILHDYITGNGIPFRQYQENNPWNKKTQDNCAYISCDMICFWNPTHTRIRQSGLVFFAIDEM